MKLIKKIKQNVFKYPNKICLVAKNQAITYSEFWEKVQLFSNFLLKKSKNKNPVVCIYETKTIYDYIAMIGSLNAGGTYVPINSTIPKKKIIQLIELSNANFFFALKSLRKKLSSIKNIYFYEQIGSHKYNFNKKKLKPNNIAYIMFTSGSTGEPKGVKISKLSLDVYVDWLINKFKLNTKSNLSQYPSISFDLSVADIYLSLCKGLKLIIPDMYYYYFPSEFINKYKINHLTCTPTLLNLISNSKKIKKSHIKSLQSITVMGEQLFDFQIIKILKLNPFLRIYNCYGPTEATVSVTFLEINLRNLSINTNKNRISIGKAIPRMKIDFYKNNKINKKDGEILISGPQPSLGYLDKKITKNKFKIINGKKYYFTGDIGYRKKNKLYFVNRNDTQIKHKGFRIEVNEINYFIQKKLKKNSFTTLVNNKLISFIEDKKINKLNLLKFLRQRLEDYKIPDDIIFIDKFPINKNGKIDYKKITNLYEKKFN